jgi:hypothetical protein
VAGREEGGEGAVGVGEAEARGRDGSEVRGEAGERDAEEGDRRRHARHGVRRNAEAAMYFVGGDKQGIASGETEAREIRN